MGSVEQCLKFILLALIGGVMCIPGLVIINENELIPSLEGHE